MAVASRRMKRNAIVIPKENQRDGVEMNSTKNLMRNGLNISIIISIRPRKRENRNSFMYVFQSALKRAPDSQPL